MTSREIVLANIDHSGVPRAGEAGADGIMKGEDMGTQTGLLFSPAMFREFFKDMYSELFAMAHDYGMKVLMHSCGMNREILPDLMDAGVDVFQFDQPALYDMSELAALMKKSKTALWSPVDIQKILPTGDREIIVEGALRMYDLFEGHLIVKNYPDLAGIGVEPEWDRWAYETLCERAGLPAWKRRIWRSTSVFVRIPLHVPSHISFTRPTVPSSSLTLMPWGWAAELVRISLTRPSVVSPLLWCCFRTTLTRRPMVIFALTVPSMAAR